MSRSEIFAAAALVAALAIVVSLRWILPLDESVYQWIQFHRTCAVAEAARSIHPLVQGSLALLIAVAIVGGGRRRLLRDLFSLLALFVAGAFTVELAKTAIDRLRPNSTPGMVSGNSFPSGHTTGTTMAAVIAILLVRETSWRPSVKWGAYALAVVCVIVQASGRLLQGSHWLSDVAASMLLASAWVLGARALARLPRLATVALVAAGCLAFALFDHLPGARFRLPSAIDEARTSLAAVEFGTPEAHAALAGEWEDGPDEPIGPVSWARSADVSATLNLRSVDEATLKVTLRPAATLRRHRGCSRVVITVNDWEAQEIALVRGWREYHVEPPPGVLRAGDNTIRFHIRSDWKGPPDKMPPGLAAFRYLRVYPRA